MEESVVLDDLLFLDVGAHVCKFTETRTIYVSNLN